jgi:hypothetical protein
MSENTGHSVDDLKKLPLRAIVAFATRCARRVEGLAGPTEGEGAPAIAEALRLAENFARGLTLPGINAALAAIEPVPSAVRGDVVRENAYEAVVRAVHAAAAAAQAIADEQEPAEPRLVSGGPPEQPLAPVARVSADLAAMEAFTAARDAAVAQYSTDDFARGAAHDYWTLLGLNLGRYPDAGKPVDPSPGGPLGPLR